MTMSEQMTGFVMCIDNRGFAASLELRKVYRCKTDAEAAGHGLVRVIDESGEDYLYPKEMFEPVAVADTVARSSRRQR